MTIEKDSLDEFLKDCKDKDIQIFDCSWKNYQPEVDALFQSNPIKQPTIMLNSPASYKGKTIRMRVKISELHDFVINLITRCLNNGNRVTFHSPERILNDRLISIFFGRYHADPSTLEISAIHTKQEHTPKERYVKNYIIKNFNIDDVRALLEAINIYPETIFANSEKILLVHMSWATCWSISLDDEKNIKFLGIGIILPTMLKENCLASISHLNSSAKICRYSLAGESFCGQILAVHHSLICKNGLPTVAFLDTWKALAEDEKNMRNNFLSGDKPLAMLELIQRI